MRKINFNNIIIEKEEQINSLISDIFEASYYDLQKSLINARSYDKFERDIFSLDCARFQLEMILIKAGACVQKYYDYKYEPTGPNDDEYRSFSYSFAALITLWKNFGKTSLANKDFQADVLEEALAQFIDNLETTKRIVGNSTGKFKKDFYYNNENLIAL